MIKSFAFWVVFLLGTTTLFSQEAVAKDLLKRAREAFELLNTNPEKALREAKAIEEEARKINAQDAELPAIAIQCVYYRGKNDFEKMMAKAKLLSDKAKSYEADVYRVKAKRYLFEAYIFTGLPEKAFRELEQGKELAGKLDGKDSLNIINRGDLFVSYSNYYASKGNNKEQLKYLNLAGQEFERMPNEEYRKKLLCIHYSNLAAAYNEINELDSAKYFTHLSRKLNENNTGNQTNISNLWVLGSVAMKEQNYEDALAYFKEAEKLEGYKNHLNTGHLYDNIIVSYRKLHKEDSARLYEAKKNSLKLSIAENQNKSLHKLLIEKENDKATRYLYALLLFLIAMVVVMVIIIRKSRILSNQERISQEYLEAFSKNHTRQNYSELLQMLEEGDPAFMNYFDKLFPGFSQKLLEINSQIIQSEIEFCSLLKLKIPTKDIARYKFITPKTVQNKKYLIRKKLNIPKDIDIYQWFESI